MYRWTEALDQLRWWNPELYKRVMGKHLCDQVNQLKKEFLEVKYPASEAQSPEAEPEPES